MLRACFHVYTSKLPLLTKHELWKEGISAGQNPPATQHFCQVSMKMLRSGFYFRQNGRSCFMFQFDGFPFVPQAHCSSPQSSGQKGLSGDSHWASAEMYVTCSQGFPFNPDSSRPEGRMQSWVTVSFRSDTTT